MLGRCQQRLCRGLLAAVQHQQQCLQFEVLSELQLVRNKSKRASFKGGHPPLTARQRTYQLRDAAIHKALERIDPTPSATSLVPSLNPTTTPSAAAAAAAPAAAEGSDTATSASSSSSSNSTSSWRPAWLDRLMDYPRLRRPAPARPSPLQENASPAAAAAATTTPAAAAEAGSSKEFKDHSDNEWQQVRMHSKITLDQYQSEVLVYGSPDKLKQTYGVRGDIPIRPPQLGNRNALPYLQTDHRRIQHARQKLHYEIISSLSAEDKALASQHLDSCIKDQDWLKRVAQVARTQPGMVLDLLRQIKRHRTQHDDLARYKESGGEINDLDDEKEWAKVLGRMKRQRAADAAARVLKNRDPDSCKLRKWSGVMLNKASTSNLRIQCPKTGLPYSECCGELFGGRNLKRFQRQKRQRGRKHA